MGKKQGRTYTTQEYGIRALASVVIVYVLGSWAIDTGRIMLYILTYAGIYFVFYYTKEFIKGLKNRNDKPTTKARPATKKAAKPKSNTKPRKKRS